jgi:threonine dehydrogenase-like Zn-dependent dehydrogenase
MRAVGLDFGARRLVLGQLPEPGAPRGREVLFRILEIGVCATDRELAHFHFGEPPAGESFLALGHEALGEVLATGSDVAGLEPGALVVPTIRRACSPPCESCAAGRRDLCRTLGFSERGIFRAHGYFTALACDLEQDLIRIPAGLADIAILAEPLSVVEKAIETALRLFPMTPRTAAIAGCGPMGLLTGFALKVRGLGVTIVSLEPEDHPRAKLAIEAGIDYRRGQSPPPSDIVLECSGSAEAARACLEWLGPPGALVLIGAALDDLAVAPLQLLLNNQSLAGVVNAAPHHFEMALGDLARMPRRWLEAMIERRPFEAWADSLGAAPATSAKIVHRA